MLLGSRRILLKTDQIYTFLENELIENVEKQNLFEAKLLTN